MGYYIRILGTSLTIPPLAELRTAVHPAVLENDGVGDEWDSLVLKHESGTEIAVVERNIVKGNELGAEEIEEFINEVQHYKPDSAAAWLRNYLPSVKVVYAFQLLDGTDVDNGFDRMHAAYGLAMKPGLPSSGSSRITFREIGTRRFSTRVGGGFNLRWIWGITVIVRPSGAAKFPLGRSCCRFQLSNFL
jgi:hypothetical protein